MSAELLEGGPIADTIKEEVRTAVAGMPTPPKLAALLATDNAGAKFYAKSQARACEEVGIGYELHNPDKTGPLTTEDEMTAYVRDLNSDASLTGIILLVPTPEGVDARAVQMAIAAEKDVEGVTPASIGSLFYGDFSLAPCTAHAVVRMLLEANVDLKGKETVVVGHSEIVGKPAAVMLLKSVMESPTVTCCHIATQDLAFHTRRADILVVAAGKAGLVKGDMVKPGAVVIDVGINRVKVEGQKRPKIVGDVEFDAAREVASLITPVPGGVGLVTTALLLANVVECARRQA